MMDAVVDVVVIGAGQVGLVVRYLLVKSQVRHVILECGAVGEFLRSQRWD
jgi:cation diffusion facilitator CzcD-associated flavoprotein CzcO